MGVLSFLPHLHSFTRVSLERLGARYRYAGVDDHQVCASQLVLMFQRVTSVPPVAPSAGGVFERTVVTSRRHLHFHRWQVGRRRLWWERRGGRIGQRWMLGRGTLEAHSWQHAIHWRGYRETRSLAIKNLRRRFIKTTESHSRFNFQNPSASCTSDNRYRCPPTTQSEAGASEGAAELGQPPAPVGASQRDRPANDRLSARALGGRK